MLGEFRKGRGPFSLKGESAESPTFFTPDGFTVEDPLTTTRSEWQDHIDAFCQKHTNVPEGFSKGAQLLEYASRGIQAVYADSEATPPSITLYYERYPGLVKNFMSIRDWSIYFNARWLARRAESDPRIEINFYTERDEVLFFGTPLARTTIIAMEESLHARAYNEGRITTKEQTGKLIRTETMAEYDRQPAEFLMLRELIPHMEAMRDIFSQASIESIRARIRAAE